MGLTGNNRIVQIHPTRRCNLRCLHCYSSSSPEEQDMLKIDLLCSTLEDLAGEGYNWMSLSGGEPLLYPSLAELLHCAKKLELNTALVTNGMLLTESKLEIITNYVDLLVLSLDGKPASHNKMRGSPRAFETMASRLEGIRRCGVPFGFLFTLTQYNLDELPWVAEFALNNGAKLLQVHPLGNSGSARINLPENSPDAIEANYAWALSQELSKNIGHQMAIQLDLMYSTVVKHKPSLMYGDRLDNYPTASLSTLVSPLIIEPDGEVVPFQFDFPRTYSLGNIHRDPIADLAKNWTIHQWPQLHSLCRELFNDVSNLSTPYFFNWYQEITNKARLSVQQKSAANA